MIDDKLPPKWEEVLRFAKAISKLDEPQRRYLEALLHWLEADDSGRVSALLKRHRAGKRVCDTYFDMASQEMRTLGPGQAVPDRWELVLGPIGVH